MGICKSCGKDSREWDFCKSCYYDKEEGKIDECKCGNFKDSEYNLCLMCYRKSNQNIQEMQKKSKVNDYSIKGRVAEAIIEEMFWTMGYRVFRFGMENTIPSFGDRLNPKKGDVAEEVRQMPDFIVVKNSHVAYIEVKYRASGEFDFNSRYKKGSYAYPNAWFILVTPKYIKIQKASKLENGKDFIFLNKCKEFETDKDIILQYIKFCEKFFGNC